MDLVYKEEKISQVMMAFLAFLIGLISGLAAIVFHHMIAFFHNLFFMRQFSFFYDTDTFVQASVWGAWIIFVPAVVAILVVWLVQTFAPEAKGHGVPEVMDSIYYKKGKIRPVVAIVKSVASALSIGSGGSVGREGPIVQISATLGSVCSYFVKMPAKQRVVLVAAGAAAGIGSVFNTPVGALAFAIELMLVSVSASTIFPVVISTVTATYIGRVYFGTKPPFYVWALSLPHFRLMPPELLFTLIPFGILMGFLAVGFIRGLYFSEDLFEKIPGNYYIRHVLGMFILGLLMYAMIRYTGHYYIQGVGYATIMFVLKGVFTNPWLLLLIVVAKMLATFLTLGSGASGGIFSPSLFLGAVFGYAFGLILHFTFPGFMINPIVFAICGMAAMIGSATGAVLTAIIMVTEMTHDHNVVMPIIITVSIAYATRKAILNESIYTLKLLRRGIVVPEGLQSAMSLATRAKHVMSKGIRLMPIEELKKDLKKYYEEGKEKNLLTIVTDEEQKILGLLHHPSDPCVCDDVESFIDKRFFIISSEMQLPVVIQMMESHNVKYALVSPHFQLGQRGKISGVITEHTILKTTYKISSLLY